MGWVGHGAGFGNQGLGITSQFGQSKSSSLLVSLGNLAISVTPAVTPPRSAHSAAAPGAPPCRRLVTRMSWCLTASCVSSSPSFCQRRREPKPCAGAVPARLAGSRAAGARRWCCCDRRAASAAWPEPVSCWAQGAARGLAQLGDAETTRFPLTCFHQPFPLSFHPASHAALSRCPARTAYGLGSTNTLGCTRPSWARWCSAAPRRSMRRRAAGAS